MRRKNFEVPAQQRNTTGITSEITVPLLACVLVGIGIAAALVVVQWGVLGIEPMRAIGVGGGTGLLAASLATSWRFYQAVVWFGESVTQKDWDKDGWVGEPEPHFVYVRPGTGRRDSELDDLRDFTQGLYTKGTGRRAWVGSRLATTGHTVTRGTFDRFCGVLLKAGVLEDLGDGKGKELVCSLDAAFDALGLE